PDLTRRPARPTHSPYTTLFRSQGAMRKTPQQHKANSAMAREKPIKCIQLWYRVPQTIVELIAPGPAIKGSANGTTPILSRIAVSDRKSTRLNSSHVKISYAVFC